MTSLELDGNLDFKINDQISLIIDDEGITINDFTEKSEAWLTHIIEGLEITKLKKVRTIRLDFEEDKSKRTSQKLRTVTG